MERKVAPFSHSDVIDDVIEQIRKRRSVGIDFHSETAAERPQDVKGPRQEATVNGRAAAERRQEVAGGGRT